MIPDAAPTDIFIAPNTSIRVLTDTDGNDLYITGQLFIKGSEDMFTTARMKVDKNYAEVVEVVLKEVIQLL